MTATADGITERELISRARSLFEFLREVQRSKTKNITAAADYAREGFALDYEQLQEPGEGVWLDSPALDGEWSLDKPVIVVPRMAPSEPPLPPRSVVPFLRGNLVDPTRELEIVRELFDAADHGSVSADMLENLGGANAEQMLKAAETYLKEWQTWAEEERIAVGIRNRYHQLFRAKEDAANDAQSWEFLLGVGRVRIPPKGDRGLIDRPILTVPLSAAPRRGDGALEVRVSPEARFRLELDMIPPEELVSGEERAALEDAICSMMAVDVTRDELEEAVRSFTNQGLSDTRFVDDEDFPEGKGSIVALRPMVIRRKRSSLETVMALDAVANYLANAQQLPPGLAAVVDPNFAAAVPDQDTHVPGGGVVTRGDQQFTPLPVNPKQWNVIKRVDTRPLTLVQGPPGTGKTHTTAALISHLLAQGKRILVTAENPEALGEVKDKLPEEVRALAVSVVGAGQQETTDLRAAIDSISRRAADFDREENDAEITRLTNEIEALLDRREQHLSELLRSRQEESEAQNTPFGAQTLAELADEWRSGRRRFEWAQDYLPNPAVAPVELGLAEVAEVQRALVEVADEDRARAASGVQGSVGDVPLVEHNEQAVDDFDRFTESLQRHQEHSSREFIRQAGAADDHIVESTRDQVQGVLDLLDGLRDRPESWVMQALKDITAGRNRAWNNRMEDVDERLRAANQSLSELRPHEPISINGDPDTMRRALTTLLGFLDGGGDFKLDKTGRPKHKPLAPKQVKEAWTLWEQFTIRGRQPVDRQGLDVLSTHFLLEDQLAGLDSAWPVGTPVSDEDSAAERIAWQEDEADVLRQVLEVPGLFAAADAAVSALPGNYPIRWLDRDSVVTFLDSLSVVIAQRNLDRATRRLDGYRRQIELLGSHQIIDRLTESVRDHDLPAYRAHAAELAAEIDFRDRWRSAQRRLASLRQRLPKLAAVLPAPADGEWPERFDALDAAWHWVRLDTWLANQASLDPNRIQQQISGVDDALTTRIGQLAASRAWGKAVARLTPDRRADLQAYVTLVKRLGKGKGKNAPRIRAEIQPVLSRCRPSVPVWIMPLYRVFESQEMKPDSFDVIIIDEASQASLAALVLLFLAPKVVVVGDDKQVSPSAVGLDQGPIQHFADTLLAWSPVQAVYKDPARSLFDEARMRFPDLITLTEHRRCVPAIIGFSDEIAYRVENVPLIPVRETGASALSPLLTTYVADGRIDRRKTNEAEQDAIVAEIRRCVQDPDYAGKSIGVISLLGSKQAQEIEAKLANVLTPDQYTEHRIRCGEPPNFQGAERDVILLSMVTAPNERTTALTGLQYVQRFNVAVSRAKDQLHLFHSIRLAGAEPEPGEESRAVLSNQEDMRYRLLEYMTRAVESVDEDLEPSEPVEPAAYDPLFPSELSREVHNTLASRRYKVVPQYPVLGRPADLVVVGLNGKVAVQCIHSNPVPEQELRRMLEHEREMLRVGWKVHRVRQSSLAIREEETLEQLLDFLTRNGIEPMPEPAAPDKSDSDVPGQGVTRDESTIRP